jgi:hypothetical protein
MTRFERKGIFQALPWRRFGSCTCRVVLWVLLLCALESGSLQGGEIDRLMAAVNGKVITAGDLDLSRSLNALVSYGKKPAAGFQDDEINRLIDLELMRQELKNFTLTQEDEGKVEARVQSLRDAYAEKGGLPAFLRQLGLQESELVSYLRLEYSILKFVDFRFRPFVSVSGDEVKTYYEERLAPQLQKSKLELPALMQVTAKIEEILREEKINAALEQWIGEIRRNSRIEYFDREREHRSNSKSAIQGHVDFSGIGTE